MKPAYLRFLATFASASPVAKSPAASQPPAQITAPGAGHPLPGVASNNAAKPFPMHSDQSPMYANVD